MLHLPNYIIQYQSTQKHPSPTRQPSQIRRAKPTQPGHWRDLHLPPSSNFRSQWPKQSGGTNPKLPTKDHPKSAPRHYASSENYPGKIDHSYSPAIGILCLQNHILQLCIKANPPSQNPLGPIGQIVHIKRGKPIQVGHWRDPQSTPSSNSCSHWPKLSDGRNSIATS